MTSLRIAHAQCVMAEPELRELTFTGTSHKVHMNGGIRKKKPSCSTDPVSVSPE